LIAAKISVTEFLERALRASADGARPVAEYAAMVVLASRTADHPRLHDQLIERWADLDDLTGRRMLFVQPTAVERASTAIPWPGSEPVALVAHGIDIEWHRQSRRWQRAFWAAEAAESNARSVRRSMRHVPERPDADEALGALTSTASELARFFDLREMDVPSLLLLSLWERRAFVIPASGPLDLYRFLKLVVDAYGDGGVGLIAAQEDEDDARFALRRAEYAVEKLRSKQQNVADNWSRQREAVVRPLQEVQREYPECTKRARRLEGLVRSGGRPGKRHDADATRVLAVIRESAPSTPWVAGSLNRLDKRLPKVLAKLAGGWPESDPDYAQLAVRISETEAQMQALNNELEVAVSRIDEIKRRISFSAAVRQAAQAEHLSEEPRRQEWRPGWEVAELRRSERLPVGRSRQ
jgi:hypothetical protein